MANEAVLVIDFGTSSVRCSVVDVKDGSFLALYAKKYPMLSARPGYAALDPEEMWNASQECLGKALENTPAHVHINGITFSFFGDNIMPVDKHGQPLDDLLLSFDIRGQEECRNEFAQRFTEREFVKITGGACPIYASGGKILWWKKNQPRIFDQAAYYFTNQQYILWKLGLPPLNDYAMACRKCMFDIEKKTWSKPILDFLNIEAGQLGDCATADQEIGTIERYGQVALPGSLPVIIGGHDCVACFIGVGVGYDQKHTIGDIASTYENMGFLAEGFMNAKGENPHCSIDSGHGPYENTSICTGAFPSSGATLSWVMRELMGGDTGEIYDKMWRNAEFVGANDAMMSPRFFTGEGGFFSLDLSKTKQDLFNSAIEALTFEGKRIVEEFRLVKGDVHCVRIGGGTARAEKWLQLRADTWNCRVERMENIEVSSLGAAMLGAVKLGVYGDMKAASHCMIHMRDAFTPTKDTAKRYGERYRQYKEKMDRFRHIHTSRDR